jgi:alanine racemase
MRAAVATISRAAISDNIQRIRAAAAGQRVYAVVKADAYGHGAEALLPTMVAAGVDGFAVACLEEAASIRSAGITLPVLLLQGWVGHEELNESRRLGLDVCIHCPEQLETLARAGADGLGFIWMKLDSGMHRIGFDADGFASAWTRLAAAVPPAQCGLMSHFACADEQHHPFTKRQLEVIEKTTLAADIKFVSTHNSAAILGDVRSPSQSAWLRPGLALFGISPLCDRSAKSLGLRPAMTFSSVVIAVKSVGRGESVGYGQAWRAERDTTIAIVAAGYGDGYPRHAANGTPLLVNGHRVPLVGRVSMDMLSVDVTDCQPVQRGDEVVLWGAGLPVEEVADAASSLGYELVCKLTQRVRKCYV